MADCIDPTAGASPSRRDFLKSSSIAMAAAGLTGSLGALPKAHAAGKDLLKVALIGCGGRGTGAIAQALKTEGNVQLVALADAFENNLQNTLKSLQKEFANRPDRIAVTPEHCFVGFDAYQKVLATDVDVVVLATSPGFRPIHFEAAVKAGKHVFMEKPVAVDGAGVRQVLAAAEVAKAKNLCVGVGLQRHHDYGYMETIKRVQDGAIGDILSARVYWNSNGVWVRPRKPGQTEMEYQMRNWYYFTWLSGDHIVEQHIHNIDVINWMKGDYPISAQGVGGREVRRGKEYGEIYDHHAVEFEYKDGSRMFSVCRHMSNTAPNISEHAQGSKGTVDLDDRQTAQIRVRGQEIWNYGKKRNAAFQDEHHHLFAAIRSGTPYNEAEYGAKSSMTAILGRLATYSGEVVTFDAALNSPVTLAPREYSFQAEPRVLPGPDGIYPAAVPGVTKVV